MWSCQFLQLGLVSAVGTAGATLGLIWVALALPSGRPGRLRSPTSPLWGVGGIIVYPVCWYLLVFRRRCYTRAQTALLVIVTYAVSCAPIALLFAALMLIAQPTVLPLFGMQLFAAGVVLLGVPYASIATPMAFLHRRFLLDQFDTAADQPPES
jgi:hypothetical protein